MREDSLLIISRMKASFEDESLRAMSPALITVHRQKAVVLYMKFLIVIQVREGKGGP